MLKIKKKLKNFYQRITLGYDPVKPKISPTVCAVPWMHLAFEPSGRVVPCCLTSAKGGEAGNLNKQTIEEIWNSPNQKLLRRKMMAGEEPEICTKCFDREKVTGESGRIFHNTEFPHVIKAIPDITLPDGTCTTMELKYWDFRFSNLCNMKCRSCGPAFSSAWIPDAKKLWWKPGLEKITTIDTVEDQTNFAFLEEQAKVVEKIYFAGGEPLLMPEHWQTLDILVKNKRFDVRISYNTNASTLTYGKRNIVDYWNQWDTGKVEVWPSIDEIGERAELIRSGTVWHKVEENLIILGKLDNINVRPGMTIGAWNVNRLPEIVTHLTDIGVIKAKHGYTNFFINLLEDPVHYHVSILNESFRQATIEKIEKFIIEFNMRYQSNIGSKFTQILHELRKPQNIDARNDFCEITKKLDKIRNEDTFKVIPELSEGIKIS
jgi:radical SAM protein with 4Fe4S-binding SPASM domain